MAEDPFSAEEVKSAFLLNFGRFVEWPVQVLQKFPDRFYICIVGQDPFGDKLDAIIRTQKIKERIPEVLRLGWTSSVDNCQIAYVGHVSDKQIQEILSRVKGKPVLTVGETSNFLKSGGMIQFQPSGERIHLSINLKSAKGSGLIISSKLLSIAEVIE